MSSLKERTVCVGEIYRHFKDRLYQIVAVAKHSETGERLVIYQQLYGGFEIYARPYEMFVSEVDHEKYPDVGQRYRFELVDRETLIKQEILPDAVKTGRSVSQAKVDAVSRRSATQETADTEQKAVTARQTQAAAKEQQEETIAQESADRVNPLLLRFLDADTYEEKRNLLVRMRGELTDRLIDDIAASMDLAVDQGEISERYISLLNCVDMMAKYEVTRFR